MGKTVVARKEAKIFGALKDRKCEVLKEDFYNGEGHYVLKDVKTGEVFESPDVFWGEQ
ncbi:hypothetical protein IMZ31_22205 (plasmid) [Pontibacillus sp. ALD_SL1]|uniref:hypothetical protein n=1 Tax=Pontibacillus sp. ALD_SL1 TaxID=2777185 RepID=UPI001A96A935|nr:hypothetical protein [Pontibacillus sp. ALD_SL1]QST02168.1 hypothetical protein IMZ31_22205 [Pontibacillus sp. ALD_SL1]